jgi:hypothetical protein
MSAAESQGRSKNMAASADIKTTPQSQAATKAGFTTTRPGTAQGLDEVFLPADVSFSQAAQKAGVPTSQSGIVYKPALFGQIQVNYLSRTYNLDTSRRIACLVDEDPSGRVTWEDYSFQEQDVRALRSEREPQNALYDVIPGWMGDAKKLAHLQNDLEDWVYRTGSITILSNKSLKQFAPSDMPKEVFVTECKKAAEAAAEEDINKLKKTYETKGSTLASRIKKQKMEIDQKQSTLNSRRTDSLVKGASVAGNVLLGLFGGRKSGLNSALSGGSATLNKHRMAEEAAARLEQEKQDLVALEEQYALLQKNMESEKADILEKWQRVAEDIDEVSVAPAKKDIYTELFGIAWLPFYTVKAGMEDRLIPAFTR